MLGKKFERKTERHPKEEGRGVSDVSLIDGYCHRLKSMLRLVTRNATQSNATLCCVFASLCHYMHSGA